VTTTYDDEESQVRDDAQGEGPLRGVLTALDDGRIVALESSEPTIFRALAAAAAAVGPVDKSDRNREQDFSYRGIERIMAAAGPALHGAGVVVVPTIVGRHVGEMARGSRGAVWRHVTLTVRYRFYGPGGDYLDAEVDGEGLDNADKATSKAMTMAYKTALLQVLGIGSGGDDPDGETPPERTSGAPQRAAQAPQPAGGQGRAAGPPQSRAARLAAVEDPVLRAHLDLLTGPDGFDGIADEAERDGAKRRFAAQWGNPWALDDVERAEAALEWAWEHLPMPKTAPDRPLSGGGLGPAGGPF
jgi:hypothetical protein